MKRFQVLTQLSRRCVSRSKKELDNIPLSEDTIDVIASKIFTVEHMLNFAADRIQQSPSTFGHGTANAEDDAWMLVSHQLGLLPSYELNSCSAEYIHIPNKALTAREKTESLRMLMHRITSRRPMAYLVGGVFQQDLLHNCLGNSTKKSDQNLSVLQRTVPGLPHVRRVLDMCTGSGCLAVLAAKNLTSATVDAVDISSDALEVAAINVRAKTLSNRITLHCGNLFEALPLSAGPYDLIVCNPPYVDSKRMSKLGKETMHEPVLALAAGADGLDVISRILPETASHLTSGGGILLEIGACRKALENRYPLLKASSPGQVKWFDLPGMESPGEVCYMDKEALVSRIFDK